MTSHAAQHTPTGRRRWLPFLFLALLVGLVLSTVPARGLSANSYANVAADQVCWLDSGVCPETYDPPNLLGPDAYAAMTPAQAGALHSLEAQAVAGVLAAHDLPGTDRLAVQTWARSDAQAALWALVVEAIKTPVGERTSVQQLAVDWMTGQVRQLSVSTAEQTGAEYASWAGLDLNRYWRLVHHANGVDGLDDAPGKELAEFLSQTPSPYDNPDTSKAKTGFCRFKPPSPYQDDYSASDNPQCYTPCTSPFGCTPDSPDYDQFSTWGAAVVQGAQFSSHAFATQAWKLKAAAFFATTAVGAGVAAEFGIAVGATVTSLLAGSTVAAEALPVVMLETWEVLTSMENVIPLALEFLGGIEAEAFAAASAASAASVVVIVVAAVVTAVMEGIKVDKGAKLPVQVATLVVSTQQASTDVAALMNTSAGAKTIFSLFVDATLPMARPDIACDNTDPQVAAVCLNAPAVPGPQADDPRFLVDGKVTPTVALAGPTPDLRRTVRVTGDWFVQQLPSLGHDEAQTLSLTYTGWDGSPQQAWLRRTATGGYRFLGAALDKAVDPDTCKSDGTCWDSATLRYVDAGGQRREASLEASAAPVGTPTYGAAKPVEGHVATLHANGFAPAHAVGTIRYGWQLQHAGCGLPCTTYTGTIAGDTVDYVWQTSGSYQARLTAMDSEGRTATTTLTVPVTDVPPVLALDPATAATALTGHPATMVATLDHAGTLDNETVAVDWGDGTPATTSGVGPNLIFMATPDLHVASTPMRGDPTVATITGTHTYTQPGTYQVRITVTDQAGQTDHLTQTVTIERNPS